jgi:hypothetical protein
LASKGPDGCLRLGVLSDTSSSSFSIAPSPMSTGDSVLAGLQVAEHCIFLKRVPYFILEPRGMYLCVWPHRAKAAARMYVESGVQSDLAWNLVSRVRSLDTLPKGHTSLPILSLSLPVKHLSLLSSPSSLSQRTSNLPYATLLSKKPSLASQSQYEY